MVTTKYPTTRMLVHGRGDSAGGSASLEHATRIGCIALRGGPRPEKHLRTRPGEPLRRIRWLAAAERIPGHHRESVGQIIELPAPYPAVRKPAVEENDR